MMPSAQLIGRMTAATLQAHPPFEACIPYGLMTARQCRVFMRWERAIEKAIEASQAQPRNPDDPTMVDAVIAALLARDDSDYAFDAAEQLYISFQEWKEARKQPIPRMVA
jgi:hypothetical protein